MDIPSTIVSLQQRFEAVRECEISRMRTRLGQLNRDQESAIDSLTHGIIDKILVVPMAILKAAPAEIDSVALMEAVHRIFNLGDVPEPTQDLPQI